MRTPAIIACGTRAAGRRYHGIDARRADPRRRSFALVAPASVAAQAATVYRCADAMGQVTYQQEPCASGTKGRPVEILPDNGLARDSATLESQWSAAAKQGVVSLGMPRRYVRDALGTPAETRQGLPVERATEVWTYRYGDGARRIGFLDGRVTWDRAGDGNTLPAQPAPRAAQVPSGRPGAAGRDGAAARRVGAAGRDSAAASRPRQPLPRSRDRSRRSRPPRSRRCPAGVQQDSSGMIVMRRPDALPLEGSGAGQPTVRVLPLPPQAGAPPAAAPTPAPQQGPQAQPALAPLSSTASTWSPSVPAQGACRRRPASPSAAPRNEAMMIARQSIRPGIVLRDGARAGRHARPHRHDPRARARRRRRHPRRATQLRVGRERAAARRRVHLRRRRRARGRARRALDDTPRNSLRSSPPGGRRGRPGRRRARASCCPSSR